jgi:hypothetical protein
MPFASPEDRNAYMREYRLRRRTALPSVAQPQLRPTAMPRASGRCSYCSGSGHSSAGVICSYCQPPLVLHRGRHVSSGPFTDGSFDPLSVWIVVVGALAGIGLLVLLAQRSREAGSAALVSDAPNTWVHWMEGIQL